MLICSTAEGSDKPYQYPIAFKKTGVIVLTRCDLKKLIYFDDDFFMKGARALNKKARVCEVNGKTGTEFDKVAEYLRNFHSSI